LPIAIKFARRQTTAGQSPESAAGIGQYTVDPRLAYAPSASAAMTLASSTGETFVTNPSSPLWPSTDFPLVVAYGLGVDSTAMLIEFAHRDVRPDLILFADTGGEKPETYAYLPIFQQYLASVGFPPVTIVRYQPKRAAYDTLEGQCLHTGTLPSLAYGGKS
jgi:hypothetical protein